MDIININKFENVNLKAVVFDFDGTISTLRHGWEEIMRPLMLEMINPKNDDIDLESLVDKYIDESTGIQTIYQMQWLAQKVKEYGKNREIHDEWWYKDEYNSRLMQNVNSRLDDLKSGKRSPEDFMIKGSKEFIKKLYENHIDLYVASGTDNEDVVNEVKALGLYEYFKDVVGAPHRKTGCSKEAVIRKLIEDNGLKGNSVLVIGDGKVEIELGKKAGTLTIGTATDELNLCGINEIKKERLIKVGADKIIGDFSNLALLADWLNLK